MGLDKQIERTLRERFNIGGELAKQCVEVSNKLSRGQRSKNVSEGLKKLDAQLEQHKSQDVRGALGATLFAQEKVAGINVDAGGNTVATVLRPLVNKEGHALLASRKIWKDPGIDPEHGEHSHRIQWFILTTQKIIGDPPAFLTEISKHQKEGTANSLWDCLFDRLPQAAFEGGPFCANGEDDFRCPEKLNQFLKGGNHKYETLRLWVRQRVGKRTGMRDAMASPKDQESLLVALRAKLGEPIAESVRQGWQKVWQHSGRDREDVQRQFYQGLLYELHKSGIRYDMTKGTLDFGNLPPAGLAELVRGGIENVLRGYRLKVMD